MTHSATLVLGARRGHRTAVAEKWRRISKVHCSEFYQGTSSDCFMWQAEEGELRSAFPAKTQSWATLQAEAQALGSADTVPDQLRAKRDFAPMFLMVYPHRVRSDVVAFVDEALKLA